MDNSPNSNEGEGRLGRPLGSGWSLWEKYQSTALQNSANYAESMDVIYSFNDLPGFALLWKHTTYKFPGELFFDVSTRSAKKFRLREEDPGEEEKIVDGLYLFREGVKPKWEDPLNHRGCSLSCELQALEPRAVNRLWKDLVFAVVGENFPEAAQVNGLRVLDRLKKFGLIKVELWLACGAQSGRLGASGESAAQLVERISKHFCRLLNGTQQVSVHQIFKKEHFIANKIN